MDNQKEEINDNQTTNNNSDINFKNKQNQANFNLVNNNEIDNNNIKNPIVNEISNSSNTNPNTIPMKNRALQYYKFLFYSIKLEIKNTEIMNLINSSNTSEILLYILSIILLCVAKFKNDFFVILHSLHFIRGIIGFFLLFKLPQSYQIVKAMESQENKDEMESKIFNDYVRRIINAEIFGKTKLLKVLSLIYFILTLLNVVFDLIDFFYCLAKFDSNSDDNINKISIFVNFIIAILFLTIDFSYIFWFQTLKYTFPSQYLTPINDAFSGLFNRARSYFKIEKKETDLKTEELINNPNIANDENNQNNINNKSRDIELNPINNNVNVNNDRNIENISPIKVNINYSHNNQISKNYDYNFGQNYSLNYPQNDNKKHFEENLDQ